MALRQEISRLQTEHGRVAREFEQALKEHQRRISLAEGQQLLAITRESDLQGRLDRSDYMWRQTLQRAEVTERQRDDIERLRHEAGRQRDEASRCREEAERQRDEAERQNTNVTLQRDAVLQSPWWRLSEPGRVLVSWMPKSLRRQVRRSAKAAWWMLTPWLMPARLRHVQARERAEKFRCPDGGPHS